MFLASAQTGFLFSFFFFFFLGMLFKFPMSLDTCRVQPNSQRLRFIRGERFREREREREREVCRNFAEVLI